MSHEHSIKGINIFPNPPIKIGIIIKNIINTPWKVIHELYCSEEHIINPGKANSNLTINDSEDPIIPPIKPPIIYNTPIYIWLVINSILNWIREDRIQINKYTNDVNLKQEYKK